MRRWLIRVGLAVVAIVVVFLVAAKVVLRTGFAANKVAAQIQEAAGGAGACRLTRRGRHRQHLHDVQFLEDGAPKGSPPWATIISVEASCRWLNWLRGDLASGVVTLRGPKLTLPHGPGQQAAHAVAVVRRSEPGLAGSSSIVAGQMTFQREGGPNALQQH